MDDLIYVIIGFADTKPYWWDLETEYEIYEALVSNVTSVVKEKGLSWVQTVYLENEDPVAQFTKHATTEVSHCNNFFSNFYAFFCLLNF